MMQSSCKYAMARLCPWVGGTTGDMLPFVMPGHRSLEDWL
jgi:hypothetical protein